MQNVSCYFVSREEMQKVKALSQTISKHSKSVWSTCLENWFDVDPGCILSDVKLRRVFAPAYITDFRSISLLHWYGCVPWTTTGWNGSRIQHVQIQVWGPEFTGMDISKTFAREYFDRRKKFGHWLLFACTLLWWTWLSLTLFEFTAGFVAVTVVGSFSVLGSVNIMVSDFQ